MSNIFNRYTCQIAKPTKNIIYRRQHFIICIFKAAIWYGALYSKEGAEVIDYSLT